ncbi:hypothetical protein [Chitinophaga nivalis]|uniref:Protein SirB1 N-terminal domain-containing protein n=1 Tax=Chitinophaga nivalis TaxID=2991709 RepID=A0ABT3INF9_9BACT|nr:hypothetical protein [Chitinophaga nivalis]MCW3464807.1 hypothetical protein [Chitinophaga nivalis]MCW3485502.1 hypothetical protein [Chitinophaga nivalis]
MRTLVISLLLFLSCSWQLTAQPQLLSSDKKSIEYQFFHQRTSGQPGLPNNIVSDPFDNGMNEQHQRMLPPHNILPHQITASQQTAQQAAVAYEIMEANAYWEQKAWFNKTAAYRQAFDQLNQFNPDSFSITNAVLLVENAFLDNRLPYEALLNGLKYRVEHVKQILKREGLDVRNQVALNYGIQKLFSQSNIYHNPATGKNVVIPPFQYDHIDFRGEEDYTRMFTIKLLGTGKGQCHSMPLLYLMIAEQLGAKAWLSLAPQHSFIQFTDHNGHLMNFETTNGHLVSTQWLYQSGFINANALKERTYLDTLSQRQLYAQCLADLLLGYLAKFGHDVYAEHIRESVLRIHPGNMTALIVGANIKREIAIRQIATAGYPPPDKLPQYPIAYQAYLDMQAAFEKVDALGYQDMPREAYQVWLKSIEAEKKKQEYRILKEKMKREITGLKNNKEARHPNR